MNKELKKEAEDYADKWIKHAIDHKSLTYWNSYVDGYIAGAEPREKRIAELEGQVTRAFEVLEGKRKRIEELEGKLEQAEKDLADYQFNYPTIKELEKENAELKNNLTKAKEIIKDLLLMAKVEHLKERYESVDEAEQFLNSEVEK